MHDVDEQETSRKPEDSQPRVGGVDVELLKSTVERIQNLETEEREVSQQKADVYKEVEDRLDKAALKIIIRRLRKARAEIDEEDFLVAEYERALGIGDRGDPPALIRVEDLPAGAGARARGKDHAKAAMPNSEARAAGRADGLDDHHGNADRWPSGTPGHGDYMLGWEDGHAERIDRMEADTLPPAESASRARARGRARERVGAS